MNAQFKRGIVELLVLKTVEERPRSSFEVIEVLSEAVDVNENTIYPILRRLSKQGYFDIEKDHSDIGAPRKVYTITKEGEERLAEFEREWETFLQNVLKILGGKRYG